MSKPAGFSVSENAVNRVKNPLPIPTSCRFCDGAVELVSNSEIYNGIEYGKWPYAYLCRNCDAYVGLHPNTAIPLGTLADADTRKARKECKPAFIALYRGPSAIFGRSEAYRWLADKLGIPVNACHWGWFDSNQCQRAAAICRDAGEAASERGPSAALNATTMALAFEKAKGGAE